MPRNKQTIQYARSSVLYLVGSLAVAAITYAFDDWLKILMEKVISGLIFLTGLYLLFYFIFAFIQKKHPDKSAFTFLILTALKSVFIIVYLFLFLNPTDIENKTEILLFLMNYFALLIIDIVVKLRLMK